VPRAQASRLELKRETTREREREREREHFACLEEQVRRKEETEVERIRRVVGEQLGLERQPVHLRISRPCNDDAWNREPRDARDSVVQQTSSTKEKRASSEKSPKTETQIVRLSPTVISLLPPKTTARSPLSTGRVGARLVAWSSASPRRTSSDNEIKSSLSRTTHVPPYERSGALSGSDWRRVLRVRPPSTSSDSRITTLGRWPCASACADCSHNTYGKPETPTFE